jgi:hypothetical protein
MKPKHCVQRTTLAIMLLLLHTLSQGQQCDKDYADLNCATFSPGYSGCPTCGDYWTCGGTVGSPGEPTVKGYHCVSGYWLVQCETFTWNWSCGKLKWLAPNCPADCGPYQQILDTAQGQCTGVFFESCYAI